MKKRERITLERTFAATRASSESSRQPSREFGEQGHVGRRPLLLRPDPA